METQKENFAAMGIKCAFLASIMESHPLLLSDCSVLQSILLLLSVQNNTKIALNQEGGRMASAAPPAPAQLSLRAGAAAVRAPSPVPHGLHQPPARLQPQNLLPCEILSVPRLTHVSILDERCSAVFIYCLLLFCAVAFH